MHFQGDGGAGAGSGNNCNIPAGAAFLHSLDSLSTSSDFLKKTCYSGPEHIQFSSYPALGMLMLTSDTRDLQVTATIEAYPAHPRRSKQSRPLGIELEW